MKTIVTRTDRRIAVRVGPEEHRREATATIDRRLRSNKWQPPTIHYPNYGGIPLNAARVSVECIQAVIDRTQKLWDEIPSTEKEET